MTDESLADVIQLANDAAPADRMFMTSLTATAKLAVVWTSTPTGDPRDAGHQYYLVYDGSRCVGAVLDMGAENLHAYTMPEARRRGLMRQHLLSVVLPCLAQQRRERQYVTFRSVEGKELAVSVGFKLVELDSATGSGRAELLLTPEQANAAPSAQRRPLTPARLEAVQRRVCFARQLVAIVQDEVRLALGAGYKAREDLSCADDCLLDANVAIGDENWKVERSAADATRA